MTDDLPRLLNAAVPEPPRALDAGELVRRARRRRTARTTAVTALTAVAVLAGITAANGLQSRPDRPPLAVSAAPTPPTVFSTQPADPRRWPDGMPEATTCDTRYPDGFGTRTFAFEGTVTGVTYDEPLRDGVVRVAIEFDVDRIFEGAPRKTVTLNTWHVALPQRSYGLGGIRVLAATDGTYELDLCGFTRRYSDATADEWAREFGPRTEYCGLDLERLRPDPKSPDRYAPEYAGMAVDEAVRLAESRDLTVRFLGDRAAGLRTLDLRADRVNLCDRDGVVTAAAIY